MAVVTGTTTTAQISVNAREIDFVSRFQTNWKALLDIMGASRPVRKAPGTKIAANKATVTLQSGLVPEGDLVPLSQATVTPVVFEDITIEKYRKRVTIEAVEKYGALVASQKTDDAFITELTDKVLDKFYTFAQTGTLEGGTYDDFQMAFSMAVAAVKDKFKKMHLGYGKIVAFVNTLDVGKYLGQANISLQTQYGMEYFKNFLGADTVIVTSEIPAGKIIATPADNIVMYYVDPSDGDFDSLGLNYTTAGETRLIGVHKEGVYDYASGDTHAVMGMLLFAEYLDGIAVTNIKTAA